MRLERYMVARNHPSVKSVLLVYSSHKTPEKAFSTLDRLRKQGRKGIYVRDRYWGERVRRPAEK